jgi:hypothetical protein
LVGSPDELGCSLAITNRWQRYIQRDAKLEASVSGRRQAHRRVDADFTGIEMTTPSNRGDGALEAGRIADREQLLRVCSTARAARLLRYAKLHLELAVAATAVAVLATSCDVCVRGV